MLRFRFHLVTIAALSLLSYAVGDDQDTTKKAENKPQVPPFVTLLLSGGSENFIKRFDKNKDGVLSKDEAPPGLAKVFERFDTNSDGKLDKSEIERMAQFFRQRFGENNKKANPNPSVNPMVEKVVDRLLQQMDTNKDGKISKAEAKDKIALFFEQLDTNKDGYLDREELRKAAARFLANQGGKGLPGPGAPNRGPEFDDLDKNADGRLTPDELKGTSFAEHFTEIDTNKDGKIDRKEFEGYLKKQAEKNADKPSDEKQPIKKVDKK
jgi:Ca2+-binding EF-hand superfamily protein